MTPFGTENLLSDNGLRVEAVTWQGLIGELRGLLMSFLGIFGWFSILLPSWTYRLFELLTALGRGRRRNCLAAVPEGLPLDECVARAAWKRYESGVDVDHYFTRSLGLLD